MTDLEAQMEEAVQAARQLNSLWLVRKNAKLLQQPHIEISAASAKLLQQSLQHARIICSALAACSEGYSSKKQQHELFRAVLQVSPAKVLAQLLHWLCCRPGTAADVTTDFSKAQITQNADMWGCGMSIWSLLLELAIVTCDNQAILELVLLAADSGLQESSVSLLGSMLQGMPAADFGACSDTALLAVTKVLRLNARLGDAAGSLGHSDSHVMLRRFISCAAPLAQLVQQCAAMMPAGADQRPAARQVAGAVVRTQQGLATVASRRRYEADHSQAYLLLGRACDKALPSNDIASGCLQLLWAYTHVLYEQHLAATAAAAHEGQLQQQQQSIQQQEPFMQQPASSRSSESCAANTSGGSSSTSIGSSSRSSRRVVQAEKFKIVPLHERMKVFPAAGRQLYLQRVRELLPIEQRQQQQQGSEQGHGPDLKHLAVAIGEAAAGLRWHLIAVQDAHTQLQQKPLDDALTKCTTEAEKRAVFDAFDKQPALPVPESQSPALLAPAVLLVIEVLMLLAALYEREAAAEGSVPLTSPTEPLAQCASLLRFQLGTLTACHSTGFSIRRSVVLRQSGHQLLQLLRWQLQRAVQQRGMQQDMDSGLRSPDCAMFDTDYMEVVRHQLAQLLCAAGVDRSHVAPEAGQLLQSLAVIHPVDYFSLVDCALQSGLAGVDGVVAVQLLSYGVKALTEQQATVLLQQPAATLSLASAVASGIKVWSLYASGAGISGERSHYLSVWDAEVLATLPYILASLLMPVCKHLVKHVAGSTADTVNHCSASCSDGSTAASSAAVSSTAAVQRSQQQHASQLVLAVLLARSLLVLTQAAEAAAARAGVPVEQRLATAMQNQAYTFRLAADAHNPVYMSLEYGTFWPTSSRALSQQPQQLDSGSIALCWQYWQALVLQVAADVKRLLETLLLQPAASSPAAAAAAAAGEQLPGQDVAPAEVASTAATLPAAAAPADGQPPSSSSSSSAGHVRWGYLLQLGRSKKLTAAVSDVNSNWAAGDMQQTVAAVLQDVNSPAGAAADHDSAVAAATHSRKQAMDEMYSAALQFCRVLAGAAPLPHLCNNLGCSSLAAGGTEAAAAVKVCSGCGAWYCSAGCAAAHWRQHKKACRRMAALRLNVNK